MALGKLLRRRAFRTLIIGQAVSSLGDWMGTIALMYLVLELSGSTAAVGGVLVLRLLPSALGAPFATRAVTRWPRRRVMLTSDLIRAGMAFALPLLPWLGWVYFWAFAIEVVALAFLPARDAAIPVLAEDRDRDEHDTATLALANGVTLGLSYGMIPLGAGLFGLILWATNATGWYGYLAYIVVFWLDALSYLVSYWAIRTLPDLGPFPKEGVTEAGAAGAEAGAEADAAGAAVGAASAAAGEGRARAARDDAGFLRAVRMPEVRAIVPGVAVVALGLGALFSIGVVFVRDVLRAGPVGFGVLVALFGVGGVLGLLLLRRRPEGHLLARIRTATLVQGLVITAMGLVASTAWALLGAVLFGAAATAALVGGITYVQESLEGTRRNVGLTAFHAVLRSGLALAALAAGTAADVIGTVRLGPLGPLAPAQTVLAVSGLVILAGTTLIRPPSR
ncbi:hypothetical protein GCM10023085_08120 [Actinomadura viridis]|uniref:MFS family permease n=1 Tax=Actinomadura viridis TaxID=58110 RepID=A0A931DSD4_9ACTN|nr:MFS transporter [Actinomadura viridis]MBG6091823.1 MFS family permease [Actinomadura viridis]